MFTDKEVDYLNLSRSYDWAPSAPGGKVDVSPVGFHFDGEAFYVGSSMMDKTHKGKKIAAEAPQVGAGSTGFIRIRPIRSWSFGILEPGFQDGKWTTSKLVWPTRG